jgi:ribonuclease R
MLPEKLSNGLCSLNPNVDRLCLFADIQVAASGKITKFQFGEGVMRSHHRLTYTQVGAVMEQPDSPLARDVVKRLDKQTLTMLHQYHDLYGALRSQRDERGAIDFETTETRIIYDENHKISAIEPVVRNVAHKMIEEAMLAANICAAKILEKSNLPALYRNHDAPKLEKLKSLQQFIGPLGLKFDWSEKMGAPTPAAFRSLTTAIANRPDREVIQTVMLRSMNQAKYEAENKGHFGLAYKAYTHFTSPIRRYPDLLVHRAIRYLIRSGEGGNQVAGGPSLVARMRGVAKKHALPYTPAQMVALGEHCSLTERRADEASRDVVQWLKCQFMKQHLGDEFEGVISSVTSFGLFVQIGDLYIEGLVHVASLDSDYYRYDDVRHALVGESSGQRYALGDSVRVRIAAVNVEDRKIDLLMSGKAASKGRRKGGRDEAASGKAAAKKPGSRSRSRGKSTGKAGSEKTAAGKTAKGAKPAAKGKPAAAKKKSASKEKAPAKARAPRRRGARSDS